MRQRIFIRLMKGAALLAVTLAAACTKEERVDEQISEIAMRPYASAATKAEDDSGISGTMNTQSYQDGGIFGVYAYYSNATGGTVWTEAFNGMTLYLSNAAFKYEADVDDSGARGWDPSGNDGAGAVKPYYWPISGSLMFAGYSPFVQIDEAGSAVDDDSPIKSVKYLPTLVGNPHFEIVYDVPDDARSDQELLYFDISSVNLGNTVSKQESALPIVFNRALAKVTFNVSYSQFDAVEVKLTECVDKGTFFSGRRPGWLPDSSVDDSGELISVKDYIFTDERMVDNDSSIEGVQYTVSRLFVPQFTNGWFEEIKTKLGDGIEIVLTVLDRIGSETSVATSSAEVRFTLSDYVPRLEMGKNYVFNVIVEPKPIQFATPSVSIDLVDVR